MPIGLTERAPPICRGVLGALLHSPCSIGTIPVQQFPILVHRAPVGPPSMGAGRVGARDQTKSTHTENGILYNDEAQRNK